MQTLLTIGYEQRTPETFLGALQKHDVEVLVDVRDRAGSRKAGFSKTALRQLLGAAGIRYVHFRELGVPAPIRKMFREHKLSFREYLQRYRLHLNHQADHVAELTQLCEQQRCCLMCVERDPEECHRSALVDILATESSVALEVRDVP